MDESPDRSVRVLLVEDNPADVQFMREALDRDRVSLDLTVVEDGESALAALAPNAPDPLPDLIMLDLNLPGIDGREVLEIVKDDPRTSSIPVVVLTNSRSEEDVLRSYQLKAACYVTKPIGLTEFTEIVSSLSYFWLSIVRLPEKSA